MLSEAYLQSSQEHHRNQVSSIHSARRERRSLCVNAGGSLTGFVRVVPATFLCYKHTVSLSVIGDLGEDALDNGTVMFLVQTSSVSFAFTAESMPRPAVWWRLQTDFRPQHRWSQAFGGEDKLASPSRCVFIHLHQHRLPGAHFKQWV